MSHKVLVSVKECRPLSEKVCLLSPLPNWRFSPTIIVFPQETPIFGEKKILTNKSSQPSPEHIQSPSWQLQQGDVDLAPDNLWSLRTTFIPLSSRITWMVKGPPLSPWQASFPEAIPHNMSSVTLRNYFRKKRGTFQQEKGKGQGLVSHGDFLVLPRALCSRALSFVDDCLCCLPEESVEWAFNSSNVQISADTPQNMRSVPPALSGAPPVHPANSSNEFHPWFWHARRCVHLAQVVCPCE